MRVLITGGTGLIGRSLIKTLMPDHEITVLTRNASSASQLLGNTVSFITQLHDVDFNLLDVVINLAGEPIANKRWSKSQKTEIEQSRWHMTQALADGINAAKTPPHTFISGSAIGYYGRQSKEPVDEQYDGCTPEFSHHLCKKWEDIALQAESPDTRVCLVRTGIVLARNGGALEKMLPAFKMGAGGPMASGGQFMSWIHIHDMVNLLVELMNNTSLSGPCNATAPLAVSNQDFSTVLANTLKRPHFFRLPKFVLQCLMGEMADLLIYGQNVVPQKLLDAGFSFKYPELQGALTDILTFKGED